MGKRHRLGELPDVTVNAAVAANGARATMHIGLIVYGSLETLSGGYLYDRQLVRQLQAAGDEVEVIALPWRNYARHLTDNLDDRLLRRLAGVPYDLLIQDELNHPSLAWLNSRLRKRSDYPIVSIVHHLRVMERHPRALMPLYRLVESRYLRSVDGLICNSRTTESTVAALLGTLPPAFVAPPGGDLLADVSRVEPPGAAGALRLLFVGNVIPRKELHTVIRALTRLGDVALHLDVVGSLSADPAYTTTVRRAIDRAGLAARVTLHGVLARPEVAEHFRRADVLVVPSSYEGYGIVYLEAAAAGIPAIGSTSGAAHEVIEDGVTGYLIPAGDDAALANRLRDLDSDRRLLQQMGRAAHRRWQSQPTWTQTMDAARDWLLTVQRLP